MKSGFRTFVLAALSVVGLVCGFSSKAQAQPGDYMNYVDVATGLGDVLYACSPPGEPTRLLIVQRNGVIRVMDNGVLQAGAFLNVGSTTVNGVVGLNRLTPSSGTVVISGTTYNIQRYNEQGLLGLAFPPDYVTSRRFYIYYIAPRGSYSLIANPNIVSDTGRTVLARMTTSANPNVANNAEERILQFDQPYVNHNGGCLQFASDGMLIVSTGDGGSANDPQNRAQDCRLSISGVANLNSWFGKLLRLDVSGATGYTVPATNPFVGQTQLGEPCRPEIYSYGLRNPWRYSFDRLTGDLWIGDVGQNIWEEVDYSPAPLSGSGANYGWKSLEGNSAFASIAPFPTGGFTAPVYVYPHSVMLPTYPSTLIGVSITGGYCYRGNKIQAYRGRYFFADFSTSRVLSFRMINGVRTDFLDHTSQLTGPSPAFSQIASFAEDADGELLVCSLAGRVRRLVPQTLFAGANVCDIADHAGEIAPNGVVNEGDYNAFFQAFFEEYLLAWPADISNSAGDISPMYAGGVAGAGPDGMVNEGDYNAFFQSFFN